MRYAPFLAILAVAGCSALPVTPTGQDARTFEPVADRSVVYVVRQPLDSVDPGGLMLENGEQVTMLYGTFYRWEMAPGDHRLLGYPPASASLSFRTEPGKVYYLRHTVIGNWRAGPQLASLVPIGEREGQALVARSVPLQ